MKHINKPTTLEQVSGNLITKAALTMLAAGSGNAWALLLTPLADSLASGRHNKRIGDALSEIAQELAEHKEKIRNLTDAQYKIINEIILTILQTADEEKIKYLKSAIGANVKEEKVSISLAYTISRILRDISADEIAFLIKNRNYKTIVLGEASSQDENDVLNIDPFSNQGILFSGLVSMGLMVPGIPLMDTRSNYEFSPIVNKILEVIGT
jgi:hypothetical protein